VIIPISALNLRGNSVQNLGALQTAFDGITPFSEKSLQKIAELKKVYELDLNASHSHKLVEK
jgi:hypothetical protein